MEEIDRKKPKPKTLEIAGSFLVALSPRKGMIERAGRRSWRATPAWGAYLDGIAGVATRTRILPVGSFLAESDDEVCSPILLRRGKWVLDEFDPAWSEVVADLVEQARAQGIRVVVDAYDPCAMRPRQKCNPYTLRTFEEDPIEVHEAWIEKLRTIAAWVDFDISQGNELQQCGASAVQAWRTLHKHLAVPPLICGADPVKLPAMTRELTDAWGSEAKGILRQIHGVDAPPTVGRLASWWSNDGCYTTDPRKKWCEEHPLKESPSYRPGPDVQAAIVRHLAAKTPAGSVYEHCACNPSTQCQRVWARAIKEALQ